MNIQENPSNETRDTNRHISLELSALILDRPQPNIYSLWSMHGECEV